MRWSAVVHSIEKDKGILCLDLECEENLIQFPLECLPQNCRVGDVLEFDVSFNPFKTLERIQKSEKEE